MRRPTTRRHTVFLLFFLLLPLDVTGDEIDLPYRQAGLSEAEAAAHLLDRFAYGARPGEIEKVVAMGPARWLERQFTGTLPDPEVEARLRDFQSLGMTTREIARAYPNPGQVLREARAEGLLDADDIARLESEERGGRRREMMPRIFAFAREKGYRPQRQLIGELMVQKLYRAVYSENQLREVLTDFWFNHFNVSLTDNETRPFVMAYERDAIRPYVTGSFRAMLEATAKHPAMLLYLDNARSVADEGADVIFDRDRMRQRFSRGSRRGFQSGRGFERDENRRQQQGGRGRPSGLNENYARELLELHTLGVDGGYTQGDIVEVARAFTGWTLFPPGPRRAEAEQRIARARIRMSRFDLDAGFVFEDDFIFRADAHDAGKKMVLGHRLAAGRGLEDGLEVLDIVAAHPSTARHIASKLATRFVSDDPPTSLVDRLAEIFRKTDGDLGAMVVALAESPEFWSAEARGRKIKSPFELAVSALRVTDAEITHPRAVIEWISRMGQPLYSYQAPTGYPDRADFWVNAGALLSRMNFGLELAAGRIPGVRLDLTVLNGARMGVILGSPEFQRR